MEMKNRAVCDELSKQLIDKWAGFIEDRDPMAFMEQMMTNESFVYALSVWGNAFKLFSFTLSMHSTATYRDHFIQYPSVRPLDHLSVWKLCAL